ncbi:MAG: quinone-dependent dihydroorotate dehydrogenase [Anaerolineaceae bacterium]|nr:MAG: quinone-dependent dihydroorotate dehydrogenase [Anaerolineaceae bacterium]
MSNYESIQPLLFKLDPERAHQLTLRILELAGSLPPIRAWMRRVFSLEKPDLHVHAFGLDFPNPVGMAAGYDKDGRAFHGLACLGFGHLELGTVTPHSQVGNPRPRIFRLPQDEALINRMGFPNAGCAELLQRIQRRGRPPGVVLGVNIGKGTDTPLDEASDDYLILLRTFYTVADYLVVNISSPNTIGLRRLQAREYLEELLEALSSARSELEVAERRSVPILVKLSPDLNDDELEDAVGVVQGTGMDGIIATNTTVDRSGLSSPFRDETGGLSGNPLRERSTEMVRHIHKLTGGELPIVGVGGIFSAEDAREKLEAGATLIQVYTGLVYRGPGLVRGILEGL